MHTQGERDSTTVTAPCNEFQKAGITLGESLDNATSGLRSNPQVSVPIRIHQRTLKSVTRSKNVREGKRTTKITRMGRDRNRGRGMGREEERRGSKGMKTVVSRTQREGLKP